MYEDANTPLEQITPEVTKPRRIVPRRCLDSGRLTGRVLCPSLYAGNGTIEAGPIEKKKAHFVGTRSRGGSISPIRLCSI